MVKKKRVQFFESLSFKKKTILWVVIKKSSILLSYSKKRSILWVVLTKIIESCWKKSSVLWVVFLEKRFNSLIQEKCINSLSHLFKRRFQFFASYSRNKVKFFASYSRSKVQFFESCKEGSILWIILKRINFWTYVQKKKESILWVICCKKFQFFESFDFFF